MSCTLAPRIDILDSAAGPRTDIIATVAALVIDNVVKIAVRMTGTIVDPVNLRIDIVGRGADLVTVIIGSVIPLTTDIATSQNP